MEMKFDSKKGSAVPSLPDALADMQARLAELQRRYAEQLSKDPSLFASLEKDIHLSFQNLADRFAASLLAHAASQEALKEQAQKK
jgi:hypothetical protein